MKRRDTNFGVNRGGDWNVNKLVVEKLLFVSELVEAFL